MRVEHKAAVEILDARLVGLYRAIDATIDEGVIPITARIDELKMVPSKVAGLAPTRVITFKWETDE